MKTILTFSASKTKADIEISLMEPEDRRKQPPLLPEEDGRQPKGGSDRWLPIMPDDETTSDVITISSSGEI